MAKCSFCGNKLESGTGLMLALKSNRVLYFCRKKCEKNWRMGRNPKKLKWTESGMASKEEA
ncbi:50S ribosomal protein L24 [Candidatus Micrarchaeota archaeon RBG_16_49_10]|nr:MAG: 50S ribosomal protein L24 [Candidatus Micrarchaeota archaeon RBG_16_49_10]